MTHGPLILGVHESVLPVGSFLAVRVGLRPLKRRSSWPCCRTVKPISTGSIDGNLRRPLVDRDRGPAACQCRRRQGQQDENDDALMR